MHMMKDVNKCKKISITNLIGDFRTPIPDGVLDIW